ncbi:Adenylate kinase isoenzyme 6 like protein [Plasmodiophora brassicae]|uniref:Adenylate kinase isoenzyme 6 homolog n=1 Tax=Plasmodiophora brassicae TaxID=37360 RepID=A0A0G4J703_PLABS|nr:hypothetical protein PBRA_003148 [Plasmodiophora brassicae]
MEDFQTTTRRLPNILITGTPGCGKTTTCEMVCNATGLAHMNVGDIVKTFNCHQGRDATFDCLLLDDEKLLSVITPQLQKGGNVCDFHTPYVFPEELIDIVLVLRTDNTILYNRLEQRRYAQNKISENIEAEIMQVVLDESRESFDPAIVHELRSDTVDDLEANVTRIVSWLDTTMPSKMQV